jgi:hypothetical protein
VEDRTSLHFLALENGTFWGSEARQQLHIDPVDRHIELIKPDGRARGGSASPRTVPRKVTRKLVAVRD